MVETAVETTTAAGPLRERDVEPIAPCTTTRFTGQDLVQGPTKTMYPNTVTETSELECGGCELVVKNVGGIGPGLLFSMTVMAAEPTTVTKYTCEMVDWERKVQRRALKR